MHTVVCSFQFVSDGALYRFCLRDCFQAKSFINDDKSMFRRSSFSTRSKVRLRYMRYAVKVFGNTASRLFSIPQEVCMFTLPTTPWYILYRPPRGVLALKKERETRLQISISIWGHQYQQSESIKYKRFQRLQFACRHCQFLICYCTKKETSPSSQLVYYYTNNEYL
jgi:hypothetical protein